MLGQYVGPRLPLPRSGPVSRRGIMKGAILRAVGSDDLLDRLAGRVGAWLPPRAVGGRIAVLVHLFYPELWDELARYAANLRQPHDLYVNLVEGNPLNEPCERRIRDRYPEAHVQVTQNRGRDIGGFLRLIDAVLKRGRTYGSTILMHSKKSVQQLAQNGIGWRNCLLRSILGSPERALRVALWFRVDRRLGIVGAREWLFHDEIPRGGAPCGVHNQPVIDEYCRRFGISGYSGDFIAGTMFWARAEPFLGFFARHDPLAIAAELPTGDHYDDGGPSRTHSWERIFAHLVTAHGFTVRGLSGLKPARAA